MGKVGDSIEAANAQWSFSGKVAANFDIHIAKSVPFYREGHELVVRISDYFLQNGSLVYDLGCSTGALTERLLDHNQEKNVRVIAADAVCDMVDIAEARCARFDNVEFVRGDIAELAMSEADLIISYYTMQFVRPRFRQDVFNSIYAALNWGGGFVLFEKVRAPDARFQDMCTGLYSDFKLERGYTEAEIVQKERSLKGVLEPFSSAGNLDLLRRAGFVDFITVYKYVCFEGFLAIK